MNTFLTNRKMLLMKRAFADEAKHVKASHRSEAIARGTGYSTFAALKAALNSWIEVKLNQKDFENFLSNRYGKVSNNLFKRVILLNVYPSRMKSCR